MDGVSDDISIEVLVDGTTKAMEFKVSHSSFFQLLYFLEKY